MNRRHTLVSTVLLFVALAGSALLAAAPSTGHAQGLTPPRTAPVMKKLQVASGTLAYSDSRTPGSTVVLLHGWPQDHSEWRHVAPLLQAKHRVISIDLPGVGQSRPWAGGFSKAEMATALHELLTQLNAGPAALVGHDIGGMMAHAYARKFPQATAKLVVLDVPLPGVSPWDQIKADPRAWHFGFFQDAIADTLLMGRQKVFIKSFYERFSLGDATLSDREFATYATAYKLPSQLAAGLGHFRAFPQDESDMKTLAQTPLSMPILYVGGSGSMGAFLSYAAQGLQATGATKVETRQIEAAGHWLAEEQPAALAEALLSFLVK
jgi:pimeloyl-ACP methyl ester carboxylesterase